MRSATAVMSEHQQTRAFFLRICRVGGAGFTRWKFVEGCYWDRTASELDSPSRPVVPDPGTPVGPESARADRINLGSTNKAVMKGDLNFIFEQQEKR